METGNEHNPSQSMTEFFREVIEWRWSEFAEAEMSHDYTSRQAVVFALVRACAGGRLPAIKEALNRIDGKLVQELEVEYPQFFYLYPYAKNADAPALPGMDSSGEKEAALPAEEKEEPLITGSLRSTLEKMSEQKRSLVDAIMAAAKEVDAVVSYKGEVTEVNPLVKSVIVAGLLDMAHRGDMGAIFEVLDQIDGKIVDKVRVLGDDVYITMMDEMAPRGAVKNENGVYQLQADNLTNVWAVKLGMKEGKLGDGDRR